MSVNSVSFVFHFALKSAGIRAHTAPATMELTTMQTMRTALGTLSPRRIMQAAVARTSDKNLTLPAQVPELHLECRGKGQRDAEQDGNLLK